MSTGRVWPASAPTLIFTTNVPFKDAKFYADLTTLEVPHVLTPLCACMLSVIHKSFSVVTPLFWSISYGHAHCTLQADFFLHRQRHSMLLHGNIAQLVYAACMHSLRLAPQCMAIASGPAGLVFAGPHKKIKNNDHACTSNCLLATSYAALKT